MGKKSPRELTPEEKLLHLSINPETGRVENFSIEGKHYAELLNEMVNEPYDAGVDVSYFPEEARNILTRYGEKIASEVYPPISPTELPKKIIWAIMKWLKKAKEQGNYVHCFPKEAVDSITLDGGFDIADLARMIIHAHTESQ